MFKKSEMTDEEMAEEYKESKRLHCIPKERYVIESQESRLTEIKQAFLAGLKTKINVTTISDNPINDCSKIDYAKAIIQDLLDNSDEYARQRAIDFLKE